MNKELLIMRHAKSSWTNESLTDFDRPLNKRGMSDAPRMALLLKDLNLVPDRLITSSAKRALSTAKILVSEWKLNEDAWFSTEELYLATPQICLKHLQELPDQVNRAMLIGHNPGLEMLVAVLTTQHEFMSTAAIAHIMLPIDSWRLIEQSLRKCGLQKVYRPKEIS